MPTVRRNERGRLLARIAHRQIRPAGDAAPATLGASIAVHAEPVTMTWRPSRHARRLLTLAAAALLLAVIARRPELAGVAGPPLLLLGAACVSRGNQPD